MRRYRFLSMALGECQEISRHMTKFSPTTNGLARTAGHDFTNVDKERGVSGRSKSNS